MPGRTIMVRHPVLTNMFARQAQVNLCYGGLCVLPGGPQQSALWAQVHWVHRRPRWPHRCAFQGQA